MSRYRYPQPTFESASYEGDFDFAALLASPTWERLKRVVAHLKQPGVMDVVSQAMDGKLDARSYDWMTAQLLEEQRLVAAYNAEQAAARESGNRGSDCGGDDTVTESDAGHAAHAHAHVDAAHAHARVDAELPGHQPASGQQQSVNADGAKRPASPASSQAGRQAPLAAAVTEAPTERGLPVDKVTE
jgi:hypothetical protein